MFTVLDTLTSLLWISDSKFCKGIVGKQVEQVWLVLLNSGHLMNIGGGLLSPGSAQESLRGARCV